MRIAAYQFAVSGNISENYKEIEKAIYIAKTENVRLLIFPECSLTGYPPRNISNASCVDCFFLWLRLAVLFLPEPGYCHWGFWKRNFSGAAC